MQNFIPARPAYKKERRTVGYMLLAQFLLLLAARFFAHLFSFSDILFLMAPVTAAIAFGPPLFAYFFYRGRTYTKALRLRAPRASYTPFLISAFFVLVSGGLLLSILFGGTETQASPIDNGDTVGGYKVFAGTAFLNALERNCLDK